MVQVIAPCGHVKGTLSLAKIITGAIVASQRFSYLGNYGALWGASVLKGTGLEPFTAPTFT